MKKLKMFAFVSIDGYSARMNGDMDWVSVGDTPLVELSDFASFFQTIDHVVMNRMQYISLQTQDFAWPIKDKSCYVLSGKGSRLPLKGIQGIQQCILDEEKGQGTLTYIREIQQREGDGDIWVMGDFRLTTLLLQNNLIDEINIIRLPVTLGSGLCFLGGFGQETSWEVEEFKKYASGACHLKYSRPSLLETA